MNYRRHSRLGEYSDDAIVQAAADLFGVHLYISSYGGVQPIQRSVAHPMEEQATPRWLHLRLQGAHFTIEGGQYCLMISKNKIKEH